MSTEISEQEYRKLKQEVEDTKSEAARAQGALDQLTSRLKEEFGCKDVKEAKAKLAELRAKKEKAETAFGKAMDSYKEKWKDE